MGSGGARQNSRSLGRSGSSESRREVGFAVKLGKLVTAHLPSGREIVGYVYGGDDYHWKIVSPDLCTHLVHKSASLSFGPASYDQEPHHEELERLVGPHREHLLAVEFGQKHRADSATATT